MQTFSALHTDRLLLIPASIESMKAEIQSSSQLATFLDARLPESWPPPLNDRNSQRWVLDYLEKNPNSRWAMWYITLSGIPAQLVGNCGFKGAPQKGTVEIGYSVAPEYQRNGYASEAVLGLVRFAFADPAVQRVIAETLPELAASIGVLKKCHFRRVPAGSASGVLRFSLSRTRWENL